jgi:pimeloyl-ACP methyl ester carboxylesterase
MFLRCTLVLLLLQSYPAQTNAIAQVTPSSLPEIIRVEAQSQKGFLYPYYLYVPPGLRGEKNKNVEHTILVIPNNTGKENDDFAVHDSAALQLAKTLRGIITRRNLSVVLLIPAFPRPKTDWQIYTHALDRDSLLATKKEYKRIDLQLIRMIDDARESLRAGGLRLDKRVFMFGFSASGMFTNRFAFLHPERVKAAAFGSPGGWAIAPVASWKGKALPYPIGVADFKAVSGKAFDIRRLKQVPLFLFMGDEDTNDSVVYRDSYEVEDEKLIFDLFGKTLMDRWPITKAIYGEQLPKATLKLYSKAGHIFNKEMTDDVIAFFSSHLQG